MRAPFQVLIIPYILTNKSIMYCLFKRSDLNVWQAISGGGEDTELPIETARREIMEEISINSPPADFIKLTAIAYIPVSAIRGPIWGEKILEVPEYTFGLQIKQKKMTIGTEHTEYGWFDYAEALSKLEWQSNKDALAELNALLLSSGC